MNVQEPIYMKKLLVISVITLLFSVSIAPAIHANISKATTQHNVNTITTQTCGISQTHKHTISLTEEEIIKLQNLIRDIKTKLHNAQTRHETITILNNAVLSLEEYDLLPDDMSVEETQKLVTQPYHNPQAKQIIEKLNIKQLTPHTNSKLINKNCLLALHTHNFTFDLGVASFIAFSLGLMYVFVFQRELPLLLQIPVSYFITYNPVRVFSVISGTFEKGDASVFTIGTHGIQRGKASMYTIYGFTGIKLMPHPIRSNEAFYLGGALLMIAQTWTPTNTLQ